ncbi:MAG: hypothetical protein AAB375_00930 [Patescibacteria group bacterium]
MKKILWLVVLVVSVGAYYLLVGKDGTLQVSLKEQNSSGESGTAILKEVDGKVQVTLTVAGQPAGVVQPVHIHEGTCAELGTVVYPLAFPKDGVASVTLLAVSLADLKTQVPLAVNAHKSGQEPQVYVACGDIAF